MVTRLTGALVRSTLVLVLVAIPSVLLPDVGPDSRQMSTLLAVLAGALTFVEYNARTPGLIEFRDAPPFNRLRFLMLFCTVLGLTLILRGASTPSVSTGLVEALGGLIGRSMDFPYSPVQLVTMVLGEGGPHEQLSQLRAAAGIAYLTSLIWLCIFVMALRLAGWPGRGQAFNVWVNLPTFDPTTGGDVIARLNRDARVNIVLGFLLPFLIPAVYRLVLGGFGPMPALSPQILIWMVTAWAFLPASLFMRGIAMGRIADLILEKRRAKGERPVRAFAPA